MNNHENWDQFNDENNEPEIWDEYRWEEFMQESDKRTEQYMLLVEKYKDHPDRKRLIAIEMGWDHIADEMDEEEDWLNLTDEFIIDDSEEGEEWKRGTIYEDPFEFDDFENFPLYQKAQQFTLDAIDLIDNRFDNPEDKSIHAFAASVILPPAKIAGGFGFGFDIESLGGNIANNKRGLAAANRMLSALTELREKELLDRKTFQDLYSRGKEVRDELAIYIVELRERFRKNLP